MFWLWRNNRNIYCGLDGMVGPLMARMRSGRCRAIRTAFGAEADL